MRQHLRAIGTWPAAAGLVLVVACAVWLDAAASETLHLFPALITTGLTSVTAAVTSVVVRRPLGDLASTTPRVGDRVTAAAALLLWSVASLLLALAAATQGGLIAIATARASLGMAGLALFGLAAGGPVLGLAAPLGWAIGTAVLTRNWGELPSWAWSLPVPGPIAWVCVAGIWLAAGAAAAVRSLWRARPC